MTLAVSVDRVDNRIYLSNISPQDAIMVLLGIPTLEKVNRAGLLKLSRAEDEITLKFSSSCKEHDVEEILHALRGVLCQGMEAELSTAFMERNLNPQLYLVIH